MNQEYSAALKGYMQKWDQLVAARHDASFFGNLQATAFGWKVQDRAEYTQRVAALHDQAEHIVETWMNGRWIAKLQLRDGSATNGIHIIKIMERRPNSTDAVGLDHIDFYAPVETEQIEAVLRAESNLQWTRESNDIIEGYDWLSIWFDGTEAKLKHDTVLDIVAAELVQLSQRLVNGA